MRKIFGLLTAAVMAFSFVACDSEQAGGATSKEFKITVSDIAATTVTISVEPTDPNKTYYIACGYAKSLKDLDLDAYAEWLKSGGDEVFSGNYSSGWWNFYADVQYAVAVFYVDKNTGEHSKKPTIVYFKTLKPEIVATEKIRDKNATLDDYTRVPYVYDDYEYYYWSVWAFNEEETVEVYLETEDDTHSLTGKFDITELGDYSFIARKNGSSWSDDIYLIYANVSVSGSSKKCQVTGYVVDEDFIRYDLNIIARPDDSYAPARKAPARKAVQNSKTKKAHKFDFRQYENPIEGVSK